MPRIRGARQGLPGPRSNQPACPVTGRPDPTGVIQMSNLPIDPRTGVQAIAILPSGRIVWPVSGGAPDDDGSGDAGAAGDGGGAGDGKTTDWEAEARKWKAMSRKHEAEAKKNSDAAAKLADAENADKTEVQRATDKAAAAEARATAAETRAARLEVAADKGLSPKLAARLVGGTKEELEADADELLAQLKPGGSGSGNGSGGDGKGPGGTPDLRGRPRENLRSGSAPDVEPEENDPSKLAALIPRG